MLVENAFLRCLFLYKLTDWFEFTGILLLKKTWIKILLLFIKSTFVIFFQAAHLFGMPFILIHRAQVYIVSEYLPMNIMDIM